MITNSGFQMSVADSFVALASAPTKTGVRWIFTSGTSAIKSLSLRVTYADTRGRGTLACSHTSDTATALEYLKSTPPPLPASLDGGRYGYTSEVITNIEGRELVSVRRDWEPSCRTSQVPDKKNCSYCSVSFSPFSTWRLLGSVMLTLCSNIHTAQYLLFTPFSTHRSHHSVTIISIVHFSVLHICYITLVRWIAC